MSLTELLFLPYCSPPALDDDDSAKETWFETAREISEDLALTLRISHEPFWQLVAANTSFVSCLESYLRFAPRPFDLELRDDRRNPEYVAVQKKIHSYVFLLFGRLACFRRSKINGKTSDDLLALLVKKKVFDAPNILDICAVYAEGNGTRLSKLLDLIFVEQSFANGVKKVVDHLPTIFNDLADELGVSFGAVASATLDSQHKDVVSWDTLTDLILFLADNAASLSAISEAHQPTAELMHNRGMEITLSSMYEAVFPVLGDELRFQMKKDGSKGEEVRAFEVRMNWARETFLKLVRRLITVNCIEPLLEKCDEYAGKECPLVDDYFQIMASIANEHIFAEDYLAYFPLNEDMEVFEQSGVKSDETTKNYVIEVLSNVGKRPEPNSYADAASRMPDLESPTSNGYSAPHSSPVREVTMNQPVLRGGNPRRRVTGPELESLITQVTDLLSEFGRGFVHACLERFDYDPEVTINALLEDNLPAELVAIDKKANTWAEPSSTEPPAYSGGDALFEDEVDPELLKIKSIHRGKRNDTDSLLNKKPELTTEEKERYWHYGNSTEYQPHVRMAGMWDDDDEYDDTYDAEREFGADDGETLDKPVTPVIPFAIEPLNERKTRGPKNWGEDEDEEDEDKPRDVFCDNPEDIRKRYEQRRGVGGHRGGRGSERSVRGNPKGAGQDEATLRNRRKKEQNKSVAANHNRRSQADWKRRPI